MMVAVSRSKPKLVLSQQRPLLLFFFNSLYPSVFTATAKNTMQQTHVVSGELAHYGSEPFKFNLIY